MIERNERREQQQPGQVRAKVRHRVRQISGAMGGAVALLAAVCPSVSAQCAMCRAAVGNSAEAAAAANGMNLAVLVLLIPPVALFCAFFIVAYRYRKAPAEPCAPGGLEGQPLARRVVLEKGKREVRGGSSSSSSRGDHDGPAAIAEAT